MGLERDELRRMMEDQNNFDSNDNPETFLKVREVMHEVEVLGEVDNFGRTITHKKGLMGIISAIVGHKIAIQPELKAYVEDVRERCVDERGEVDIGQLLLVRELIFGD